ncbi:MAG: zinc finger Ran-binding domain-containing protein [Actinomycetota bacterium]|nr:zinc finger Ran-binding domain-containing protein [Actinomycetota bacterium]
MIDSDLFQTIALALLFLILLVQLIQLAVLNGMRRSMGSEISTPTAAVDTSPTTSGYGAATTGYGAATSSYEPAGYGGAGGYGSEGAGSYGGYSGTTAQTATPAQTLTPTETPPAAEETRPEVATSYVPLEQATPAAQQDPASTMLTGTEPEEQPFERDGRWWFKRGGELLVYDEGTGQWVAAPGGYGSAGTAGGTTTTTTGAQTATASSSYSAPAADTGEGWRCASCGAINGSTATVCRMCFTPRA